MKQLFFMVEFDNYETIFGWFLVIVFNTNSVWVLLLTYIDIQDPDCYKQNVTSLLHTIPKVIKIHIIKYFLKIKKDIQILHCSFDLTFMDDCWKFCFSLGLKLPLNFNLQLFIRLSTF